MGAFLAFNTFRPLLYVVLALSMAWQCAAHAAQVTGRVIDGASGQALAGAHITLAGKTTLSAADGQFTLPAAEGMLMVRARGYARASHRLDAQASADAGPLIRLQAFHPKALYLSIYGIGDAKLREAALALIDKTELNSLVIDVKGDRGLVPFELGLPAMSGTRARAVTTVRDLPALIGQLKARGIYLIARIVVFKDDLLAQAHPEWAVRTAAGNVFHDREGFAWIDPSRSQAWPYFLDIAAQAAALGFDEIQFDYLRFPDAPGLLFSVANSQEARVGAIGEFLGAARARLQPYNVFIAADIFGYVAWNGTDTGIGQQIEALATQADYLCPMVYPSGYRYGIPGIADPVSHPFDIVFQTLERARRRSGATPFLLRPWLQAFGDYAFDHRAFGASEIRAQINAAERSGSDGWMLWNPNNVYQAGGLEARH